MRALILMLSLVPIQFCLGVYEMHDAVAETCWKDLNSESICLGDHAGKVRVLLFNAGWCGPCNTEFQELVPRVGEFNKKPIIFISLSSSGWSQMASPDPTFLKQWKDRHNIPFPVAGSPRDAGKAYFHPPYYIPSVVIIDPIQTLVYKAVNPGAHRIIEEVKKHIPTPVKLKG